MRSHEMYQLCFHDISLTEENISRRSLISVCGEDGMEFTAKRRNRCNIMCRQQQMAVKFYSVADCTNLICQMKIGKCLKIRTTN